MYVKKIYYAGDTIEVELLYSAKYPPKKRENKSKPTKEQVKKFNEKLAEDRLRRKINTNFNGNDLHIVLPYRKGYRPGEKEIKSDLRKFKDKLKKEYKLLGKEFKWFQVTGFYDKDGIPETGYDSHNETQIHHHMIIKGIDYTILTRLWNGGNHNRLWFYPLDFSGDYTGLAVYFFGHTKNLFREDESPYKKRWSCSRNLTIPPPPDIKIVEADTWRKSPRPQKGYFLITDSIKQGVSEITGYPYLIYRMVKIKNFIPKGNKKENKKCSTNTKCK